MDIKVTNGHIDGWQDGRNTADIAWWQDGKAERTCGIATELEALELLAAIEADPGRRICWTAMRTVELTSLADIPEGAILHWTNWPGRASVPVTRVYHADGNIRFADGSYLFAMPDELTRWPRAGLEA